MGYVRVTVVRLTCKNCMVTFVVRHDFAVRVR